MPHPIYVLQSMRFFLSKAKQSGSPAEDFRIFMVPGSRAIEEKLIYAAALNVMRLLPYGSLSMSSRYS